MVENGTFAEFQLVCDRLTDGGVFGVAGAVMDNYALEVVILAHSEGEIGVFGVAGVVMDNYA